MSNTKTKQVSTEAVTLATIQAEIKAPKGQFNSFGKYKYRSAEDIVEAVKPVIHKYGFWLLLTDDIVQVGDRIYIKATATLSNGTQTYTASAYAREEEAKKGMDASQVSGACGSYARKYSLNGLFAIDDTKDSDATNDHSDDKSLPLTDDLMTKFVARYNGGEKDIWDKVRKHYKLTKEHNAIIDMLVKETN
jgi:hypothetical protein